MSDLKARLALKHAMRARRDRALSSVPLPQARFGVILADPPWRFKLRSALTGGDRAAENHYPTMSDGEILALPVNEIAERDCVLFLWSTVPKLSLAFEVIEAWGFRYRSQLVWVKRTARGDLRPGLGYWTRNCHENLLIATRGFPACPKPGTQALSVLDAELGRHSQKPNAVLLLIENIYPQKNKIEIFARGKARAGWSAWGNELEPSEQVP